MTIVPRRAGRHLNYRTGRRYAGRMPAAMTLTIVTGETGPPAGGDSAAVAVPASWYITIGGRPALLAPLAGLQLRHVSEEMAAHLGERLHHAEWTITGSPDGLDPLIRDHDCASCRERHAAAVAYLAAHPGAELAVGKLWWA